MKNRFYMLFLLFSLVAGKALSQSTIFAAPTGSAGSNGSSASAPTTFTNAIALVTSGGTISLAAGTYNLSASVLIQGKNGTSSAPIKVFASGGAAILNFSGQATSDSNRGIILDANYWYFKGITIQQAGDNGMLLSGNNNTIENCTFTKNRDTGLQMSRYNTSASSISQWPSNNLVLNSESFDNYQGPGDEDSDGFDAKLTAGVGNVFRGCISHNNIDDGWDLFTKTDTGPIGVVTIEDCISYGNGTLTNGTTNANGDRNGFKLGGSGIPVNHIVRRCIAFNNGHHGFTDNNNPGSIEMSNNTSWNNVQSNFNFRTGGTHVFRNNLSFNAGASDKNTGTDVGNSNVWWINGVSTNGKGLVVSSADFVSLTPTISRNADGSPNIGNFLALASGSDMINAGVTAPGITFNGSAPDIGARESGSTGTTTFTLTTSASPAGSGTVTLSPAGGSYASGTVVTLTATAASGNTFTGWSGDASGTSTTTTVTMNATKTVVANFTGSTTNPTASLTATAGNAQVSLSWTVTGTVTGQQIYRDTDSNVSGRVLLSTPAASARTFTDNTAVNGTAYFYWVRLNGTTDSNAASATPQAPSGGTTTIRIEETATSTTGLCSFDGSIASNSGADDGKVINLSNSSGKGITWRVTAPARGSYTLTWRYKNNGSQAATSAKLIINGTTVNTAVAFPKTSGSTVFTTTTASVTLEAGGNDIRLETTVSSEFADIDWIQITGSNPVASSCTSGARLATNESADVAEQFSLNLTVYPNPNHGLVTAEFVLPQNGNVSVRIMDSLGKGVTESIYENYSAGFHRVGIDLSNSKNGLYIFHLQYGTNVLKKKIILER